ncbi:PASTA domain-containing protein [Hymenobacter caeli]|uniref:Beta-lactam-binding protein with PASTA domain n=1 Tax=Hymenobacter caeli TaxID=2735894 RepID=A0ABX2FUD6_9BACT|nr:PASTA domain-containing protein [Hymenobacter caeli]NRT20448.1 beta-lactam-binding protein with PASTA domain [Hymenobacter caeli]
MASFFKANTPLDVVKHLALVVGAAALLVLGFFYVYLPVTTHHGETITVPKVTGMNVAELEKYLDARHLAYFVDDSSYNPDIRPLTVLTQDPAPGEKVKEGRKIYLQVAMKRPPVIKMPKLVDGSVKNAQLILQSYDLVVGQIKMVPNLAQNAVLRQFVNGKEIAPGAPVAKGTRIDLEVGDGLGNQEFLVPDLVKMPQDEALTLLAGQGLQKGEVFEQAAAEGQVPGTVVRQRPVPGPNATIRTGQLVDLWIAK